MESLENEKINQDTPIVTDLKTLTEFAEIIAHKVAKKIIVGVNFSQNPLSEKEVCERLQKTRPTLIAWRKKGKIRYHRIGREIMYFPSELDEDLRKF